MRVKFILRSSVNYHDLRTATLVPLTMSFVSSTFLPLRFFLFPLIPLSVYFDSFFCFFFEITLYLFWLASVGKELNVMVGRDESSFSFLLLLSFSTLQIAGFKRCVMFALGILPKLSIVLNIFTMHQQ